MPIVVSQQPLQNVITVLVQSRGSALGRLLGSDPNWASHLAYRPEVRVRRLYHKISRKCLGVAKRGGDIVHRCAGDASGTQSLDPHIDGVCTKQGGKYGDKLT